MTNEELIYELCVCMIDLIDELSYDNEELKKNLEWVKDEVISVRKNIFN